MVSKRAKRLAAEALELWKAIKRRGKNQNRSALTEQERKDGEMIRTFVDRICS